MHSPPQSVTTKIEAGLPNITGSIDATANAGANPVALGVFYETIIGYGDDGHLDDEYRRFMFDASRCSSIYGNSTTVQPPALTINYYIRAK